MAHPSLQDRVEHLDNATHRGGERPAPATMLLLHASESNDSARQTIRYLNTTIERTASYNFLIERDGAILRMVPAHIIAYHAGDSAWPDPKVAVDGYDKPNGGRSVNGVAIGICWANNGRNTGAVLTPRQVESGLWLCGVYMVGDDAIPLDRVLGHYHVSPGRKIDPRPAVDVETFREQLADYLAAA